MIFIIGGKIRVIDTEFGLKTLLRNHEKTILDMCIQETPITQNENEEAQGGRQLLLAVGADSKITVWELLQPPAEQEAEIPYASLSYFVNEQGFFITPLSHIPTFFIDHLKSVHQIQSAT